MLHMGRNYEATSRKVVEGAMQAITDPPFDSSFMPDRLVVTPALVHASLVRDRTIKRIRELTGWTNLILHYASLTRDMSDVDLLSQDAQHRSAYNGVYLVFRSEWKMIDSDSRTIEANGCVRLHPPNCKYM
jgi:hypothetical protein